MGWTDDIRAKQNSAAGQASSEEATRVAAYRNYVASLDQVVPEIAKGLKQLEVPADRGGLVTKRWRFDPGPSGTSITITSGGKWYWGWPYSSKIARQNAESHPAWINYRNQTASEVFADLQREVEVKALKR